MVVDNKFALDMTSKMMSNLEYMKKVYETIETPEQWESFTNLCNNHLQYCNVWLKRIEPKLKFIPRQSVKIYKRLYSTAEYTVNEIQNIIYSYNTAMEQQMEELKQLQMLEKRCRIEHEIAIEYQEMQTEKAKKSDAKKKPIGFVIPKKKRKKKNE